ncbi:helix-turn-helix domain-containing protein [Sphaerotilaceae bacterium SBD11-9]
MNVHVGYCRAVLAYLRQQGVDPAGVFSAAVLHRVERADTVAAFALDDFHALLDEAQARLGDPGVALKASEMVQTWEGGVLGFTLMTSPCISEVGTLLVRYQRLFSNVYRIKATLDERHFELRLLPTGETLSPRLAHMLMGAWASRARWLTGEPGLRFDASFEGPPLADMAAYERCFGGSISFHGASTAMVGLSGYLALPVRQHDPAVNGVLRTQAANELERLDGDSAGLLVRVRRGLRDRLGSGPLTLDALAADLDMAPRTLQSHLEELGLSFRVLLDGVRDSKAKQYLAEPQRSLTDIALALGFANQSAFQHAFKRWSGLTPGQWRRSHLGRRN